METGHNFGTRILLFSFAEISLFFSQSQKILYHLKLFFQVQAMNYKGAMLWVATSVAISVVMILILNFWSDKQQDIVGKRVRGGK